MGVAITGSFLLSSWLVLRGPYPGWRRRPVRHAAYWPLARWGDTLAGRRDGRRRIVVVSDADLEAGRRTVTTPRVAELMSITEQRMFGELARHHRELTSLRRLRSTQLAPLDAQMERTELAGQVLADLEKDQDLSRWAREADARHSECYVRRRRLAEAERCRAEAAERYTEEKERLGELLQRVATVDSGLAAMDDVTRSRVQQACAHGTRRIFNYWASFVRSHPQGGDINERFVPAVPSPTEVTEQS